MPLNKNFLNELHSKPKIPENRLLAGIFLGLGFAFTIYSLLYICRDLLPVIFSLGIAERFSTIATSSLYRQNLVFAFIAVLLGYATCINFWFDRPRQFLAKRNYRKLMIAHDQRALHWFFMNWAIRLVTAYLLLSFGCDWVGIDIGLEFLPPLVIIVLFLQSWTTIRLVYKRNSLKTMLSSAVLLTGLALCLSLVNFNDVKGLNKMILAKDIHTQYQIALPASAVYQTLEKKSLVFQLYLVLATDSLGNQQVKILNNYGYDPSPIEVDEIGALLLDWQKGIMEQLRPFISISLIVDKRIKMDIVAQVKAEFQEVGKLNIAYAVETLPPSPPICGMSYSLVTRMPPHPKHLLPQYTLPDNDSVLTINLLPTGEYLVADEYLDKTSLRNRLLDWTATPPSLVKFNYSKQAVFDDYLWVLSSFREGYRQRLNVLAEKEFKIDYESLAFEDMREIRRKNPFVLVEFVVD